MPTLDCLPFYVAQSEHIFDKFGLKVSLRLYTSQMDCDTALLRERVAISVSDMIRAEGLKKKGMHLDYLTGTDTYWQLITNKASRVQSVNQLGDKMIGITRFSATQTLLEKALEDGRLSNPAYPIQVNDVSIRLEMLKNKSIDAALLTEPQASIARKLGHVVIFDSRTNDYRFGVFVVNVCESDCADSKRKAPRGTWIFRGNDVGIQCGMRLYKQERLPTLFIFIIATFPTF